MSINESNRIVINNRKEILVSGIKDVVSYDSEKVVFKMLDSYLSLTGKDFNVKKLDVDSGDAEVTGELYSLSYSEISDNNKSFLMSLFK